MQLDMQAWPSNAIPRSPIFGASQPSMGIPSPRMLAQGAPGGDAQSQHTGPLQRQESPFLPRVPQVSSQGQPPSSPRYSPRVMSKTTGSPRMMPVVAQHQQGHQNQAPELSQHVPSSTNDQLQQDIPRENRGGGRVQEGRASPQLLVPQIPQAMQYQIGPAVLYPSGMALPSFQQPATTPGAGWL